MYAPWPSNPATFIITTTLFITNLFCTLFWLFVCLSLSFCFSILSSLLSHSLNHSHLPLDKYYDWKLCIISGYILSPRSISKNGWLFFSCVMVLPLLWLCRRKWGFCEYSLYTRTKKGSFYLISAAREQDLKIGEMKGEVESKSGQSGWNQRESSLWCTH